jgi:hypothetical protein
MSPVANQSPTPDDGKSPLPSPERNDDHALAGNSSRALPADQ